MQGSTTKALPGCPRSVEVGKDILGSMESANGIFTLFSQLRCYDGLEDVEITCSNPFVKSIDGIVYSSDGTRLLFCPPGRRKDIIVAEGTREICRLAIQKADVWKVSLPGSLQAIGLDAFARCKIGQLRFAEGITEIGDMAFNGAKVSSVKLPGSLRKIGARAFAGCGLREIEFNEGLESIGYYAFSGNQIEKVSLPQSLVSIGEGNFPCAYSIDAEGDFMPRGLLGAFSAADSGMPQHAAVRVCAGGLKFGCPSALMPEKLSEFGRLWDFGLFGQHDAARICLYAESDEGRQDAALITSLANPGAFEAYSVVAEKYMQMQERYRDNGDIMMAAKLMKSRATQLEMPEFLIQGVGKRGLPAPEAG